MSAHPPKPPRAKGAGPRPRPAEEVERLARALRANVKRRRAQKQARQAGGSRGGGPGGTDGPPRQA
jgi:hypothetical protein